ncbi:Na/Pi symporter [Corynebacterium breve]|uniref:Na/Pi symporter n=1 Tax=Corynebacterium breve TaxID=3049799 RepID=A0ABY8VGF9_9CORY|nr:Na/Pi symporter [Corynebacterium breve]WIM68741.1 Na/Pi symporter [Corynebacterium breve]
MSPTSSIEDDLRDKNEVLEETALTETDEKPAPKSPLERFGFSGKSLSIANWVAVALCIYLLITAVSVIGDGFKAATGDQAEQLFAFASNPIIALMIGLLATALIQSSSTTTSIVVGLVAGGLPMGIAIPMLMGANIGTSLTSTLVSLGMVKDKESFRRAFGAATVHDMYNLLAVLILFPLEIFTGYLEKLSGAVSRSLASSDGGIVATLFNGLGAAITFVTDPLADLIGMLGDVLPAPWGGILLIIIGVAGILIVINMLGDLLQAVLVGRAKEVMHTAIGRGPISGITSGTLVTAMVQSSSTTTSLLVPLAGAGTISLKQVLPFTVGANIGTTVTALLAAFAFTGVDAQPALQAALVHMFFNITGALIVFLIPGMKNVPIWGASTLARLGAENKLWVVGWVVGVFVILPAILIGITVLL